MKMCCNFAMPKTEIGLMSTCSASSRAGHAHNIPLVLLLNPLLDGSRQLIDFLCLIRALELPVPILPAQIAVLLVFERACATNRDATFTFLV